MASLPRSAPFVVLGVGALLLVAAGICYQVTRGGAMCHWLLGVATLCCIGAFAMALQRNP